MVKHVEKVNMVKKNIKNKKSSVVSVLLYRYIGIYQDMFCVLKKHMKTIQEICKQNNCEY